MFDEDDEKVYDRCPDCQSFNIVSYSFDTGYSGNDNYLFVNRNMIEIATLFILFLFPSLFPHNPIRY